WRCWPRSPRPCAPRVSPRPRPCGTSRHAGGAAVTFASFVVKNLLRQRVRTGLTVLGIAVGITTVVALGVLTSGFATTAGAVIRTGGADLMVAQEAPPT